MERDVGDEKKQEVPEGKYNLNCYVRVHQDALSRNELFNECGKNGYHARRMYGGLVEEAINWRNWWECSRIAMGKRTGNGCGSCFRLSGGAEEGYFCPTTGC